MKSNLLIAAVLLTAVCFFVSKDSYAEPRRVALEFVTGTWCQYCPCGDAAAESILQTFPNTIVIAYHGASSDPWQNFHGNAIRSLFGFSAYPTGVIDRTNHPGNGSSYPYVTYNMWMGLVSTRYASSPNSVINVVVSAKNYNTSTRQLTGTIDATAIQDLTGQYKVHFILTESNVVYLQTGNGGCPGGSNYVHKWIVRDVINDAPGENLNTGGVWNLNQTISKSFSCTIDNAWIPDNCDFAAIVYKDSTLGLFVSNVQQGVQDSVPIPLGVSNGNEMAKTFSLLQNYPNPFNPVTHVQFVIPKDGNASLKIYDVLGNEVATYLEGYVKAGKYNAEIDGSNWASGVYFYKLTAGDYTATKKMILAK
jgi:hypothetical protein